MVVNLYALFMQTNSIGGLMIDKKHAKNSQNASIVLDPGPLLSFYVDAKMHNDTLLHNALHTAKMYGCDTSKDKL